jgi:hypothetical protein
VRGLCPVRRPATDCVCDLVVIRPSAAQTACASLLRDNIRLKYCRQIIHCCFVGSLITYYVHVFQVGPLDFVYMSRRTYSSVVVWSDGLPWFWSHAHGKMRNQTVYACLYARRIVAAFALQSKEDPKPMKRNTMESMII